MANGVGDRCPRNLPAVPADAALVADVDEELE